MRKLFIPACIILLSGLISCNDQANTALDNTATATDTLKADSKDESLKIAFFYGDSINENYDFLQEANDELDQEEKTIQERLERKMRKAEQRAAELQQQAPTMTQMQMQEAQLELQNLDLEYQRFQEKLTSDFRKREIELRDEYIQRVDSFLDEYNLEHNYDFILNYQRGGNLIWANDAYDITQEVIDGLNKAYAAELATEKPEQP
jgi:outer membrane protein